MKQKLILSMALFLFSSCSISNRIIEINDSYKGIKGFRLDQNPEASSSVKIGTFFGKAFSYPFTSAFIYEERGQISPSVSVEIHLQTPIRTDELDSVMFLNLDNEKIKIVANNNKYKQLDSNSDSTSASVERKAENKHDKMIIQATDENSSYLLMTREYQIPETLWVSIANADLIQYRLYMGKEGIDVKLNPAETHKLREFFSRTIELRNANLPPVPEGKKKW
jgi:hypothetical protein